MAFERTKRAVQAAKEAKPGVAEENKGIAFLLGSFTVVVGVFTALGLTGGLLGRMARNHDRLATAALTLALLAVVLAVVGSLLRKHVNLQFTVLGIGLLCFLAAAVCAVRAGVKTWGDTTSPRLTTTVVRGEAGPHAEVAVKSSGLRANARVLLAAWPIIDELTTFTKNGPSGYEFTTLAIPLYQTTLGADADGDLNVEVRVPLHAADRPRLLVQASLEESDPRHCYRVKGTACATITLPDPGRPRVLTSWVKTPEATERLKIDVRAEGIGRRRVYIHFVRMVRRSTRTVESAVLAPDGKGDVAWSSTVRLPPRYGRLCVVASTLQMERFCPPRASRTTVAADNARCRAGFRASGIRPTLGELRRCRRQLVAQRLASRTWVRVSSARVEESANSRRSVKSR